MNGHDSKNKDAFSNRWTLKVIIAGFVWGFVYSVWPYLSAWMTFEGLGLKPETRLASAVEFFLYDTGKIFLLLIAMIYMVAWFRAQLRLEVVRDWLQGKGRMIGYAMASLLGAITPFCSCSSIPLFIGFSRANIPFGVTMAFLITSPIINEVAVVMLWELLGWKLTVIYVLIGLVVGILGGLVFDLLKANRWMQPQITSAIESLKSIEATADEPVKLSALDRHRFAFDETRTILKNIAFWVIIGVGIGAGIHGYVPEDWFLSHLNDTQWWNVPLAVACGIPLYTNVTGVVPIMESLLTKGLPLGTTLAFTMSTVAASLPEFIMLKNVMQTKLLVQFAIYLLSVFSLVGWFLNAMEPTLVI